jgi:hypothetical protein
VPSSADRTARCILGDFLGKQFETKIGLPQGSVISPTLFNLFIEDLASPLVPHAIWSRKLSQDLLLNHLSLMPDFAYCHYKHRFYIYIYLFIILQFFIIIFWIISGGSKHFVERIRRNENKLVPNTFRSKLQSNSRDRTIYTLGPGSNISFWFQDGLDCQLIYKQICC